MSRAMSPAHRALSTAVAVAIASAVLSLTVAHAAEASAVGGVGSRTRQSIATPSGHLINYPSGPRASTHMVYSAWTADKYLPGASLAFKRFAARTGAKARRFDREHHYACWRRSGVHVQRYHTRGFAYGVVGGCQGGHGAIWARPGGKWRTVSETQDLYSCEVLTKYRVPASLLGKYPRCWSQEEQREVAYHHA